MNNDVVGIIERYSMQYDIANFNKRYNEECSINEDIETFRFYYRNVSYNFRDIYRRNYKDEMIYDIHYRCVCKMSPNY